MCALTHTNLYLLKNNMAKQINRIENCTKKKQNYGMYKENNKKKTPPEISKNSTVIF
jgi:hypothetical protein